MAAGSELEWSSRDHRQWASPILFGMSSGVFRKLSTLIRRIYVHRRLSCAVGDPVLSTIAISAYDMCMNMSVIDHRQPNWLLRPCLAGAGYLLAQTGLELGR